MLKIAKFTLLLASFGLSACASVTSNQPSATLTFQNGQAVTIRLNEENPALNNSFLHWSAQGVYNQAPVYRQLPGIFVLTGKPRLAGQGFVAGTNVFTPDGKKPAEAKTGDIGLVVHADGSVGPELILIYGQALVTCCEAPANIRIGSITSGRSSLKSVERGDNLQTIAIKP